MSELANAWFDIKSYKAYSFQKQSWKAIGKGKSGLLNAPTGYGKTMAMWFGILEHFYKNLYFKSEKQKSGLHCLWITPLRALSKEIFNATTEVSQDLNLDYTIALRTGDTSTSERMQQKKHQPNALITTPESVHILLANKGYPDFFKNLSIVVIDEWHELLGSKRGVLVELALSRLKALYPQLIIWGVSATIGNLDQAMDILLGNQHKGTLIKASLSKKINIQTIFPDDVEKFPWGGHLGLRLLNKVIPIIDEANTTLIFTNTRSQAEIWYQQLLLTRPDYAGIIALHHGSLSEEIRVWVENALHEGILKAVVCTSSLDLGVDFRPVDKVIQIGSPKGIARFLQRAGRSGHQPGATSTVYFLPTHSLEIMESASLKYAFSQGIMENRIPYIRSFDVLIQYMVTLAISEGFIADELFEEVRGTHCFASMTKSEFNECLLLNTKGGKSLDAYEEFHKVIIDDDGKYKVISRKIAHRHRLSMGTIVNDAMVGVKMMNGKYLGSLEESFISRLKIGDAFWFSGRCLELIRLKDMTAFVKSSKQEKGLIPSWGGGRLPISVNLGAALRHVFKDINDVQSVYSNEVRFLKPLFKLQQQVSALPTDEDLLVEYIHAKDGYHLFVYPFEGKFVHEGMASIIAYRLSQIQPATFSIATNEYGFDILCDESISVNAHNIVSLFSLDELTNDIQKGINTTEMAKRRFRDIAGIAGLVFQGFPGKKQKTKHLQANSSLFFKVFEDYEKDNILLKQSYEEVFDFQLEIARMVEAFKRIEQHKIIFKQPKNLTPFAFPVFAESFREKYSNEDWQSKLLKLKKQLEK